MVGGMEKIKAGRVVRKCVWGWRGSDYVLRGLTWKMVFEQRPKGSDRAEPYGYVWE